VKILGHSNIKMTERYANGREHIAKTGTTAKVIWNLMKMKPEREEGHRVGDCRGLVVQQKH
jgi:hypothetical protein